jgi:hypothetical protein
MKTFAAWTAALALGAAGAALAQQPRQDESLGQAAGRVFDRAEEATSRTVNPAPGDPSFGQRAGRVFDRMEDGVQGIWNRATGRERAPEPPRARVEDPTREMGAGGMAPPADPGMDPIRRQRMDEAYRNWQSGLR